jgi:hypothetical protein
MQKRQEYKRQEGSRVSWQSKVYKQYFLTEQGLSFIYICIYKNAFFLKRRKNARSEAVNFHLVPDFTLHYSDMNSNWDCSCHMTQSYTVERQPDVDMRSDN